MRHGHRQARWLHTRISETLEDALKREARRRRLPVSLLVRNVLEGALDLVEDIVETSLGVARPPPRRRGRGPERDGLRDIYGWQELILNRPATCVRCQTALAAGGKAFRGLSEQAGPAVFLCLPCIRRLGQPAREPREEPR